MTVKNEPLVGGQKKHLHEDLFVDLLFSSIPTLENQQKEVRAFTRAGTKTRMSRAKGTFLFSGDANY